MFIKSKQHFLKLPMGSYSDKKKEWRDRMFQMPEYRAPDFKEKKFMDAPDAVWEEVKTAGVAPEGYHSTSMYPEYYKIMESGNWQKRAGWIPALS